MQTCKLKIDRNRIIILTKEHILNKIKIYTCKIPQTINHFTTLNLVENMLGTILLKNLEILTFIY